MAQLLQVIRDFKFSNILDSKDTLTQKNVSACDIDVVVAWVTRVDHQAVDELHGLGSLTSELAGDNDLAALSARLHDESEDTVAGPEVSECHFN